MRYTHFKSFDPRWRLLQATKKLTFLLTQQSVARDSPFKIAQWTPDHAEKKVAIFI